MYGITGSVLLVTSDIEGDCVNDNILRSHDIWRCGCDICEGIQAKWHENQKIFKEAGKRRIQMMDNAHKKAATSE
jgi:hypothetical protein